MSGVAAFYEFLSHATAHNYMYIIYILYIIIILYLISNIIIKILSYYYGTNKVTKDHKRIIRQRDRHVRRNTLISSRGPGNQTNNQKATVK